MKNEQLKYWKAFPALAIGGFVGLSVILLLRMAYYDLMGNQPNMHPGIAFYFSPILFLIILGIALPGELVLRPWYAPTSKLQASMFGMSYSTILTLWAFPPCWFLGLVFNPGILRIFFSLTFKFTGREQHGRISKSP